MSSIPAQQKALFLQTKQGNWKVDTTDVPKPKAGEVLIRIEATALSPIDWKIRVFGYELHVTNYLTILGTDSAGVVVQLGEGVTSFAIGDKVLHQGQYNNNRATTFQQYTAVSAELVVKLNLVHDAWFHSGLTFSQAATIPVAVAASTIGLYGPRVLMGGAGLTAPWQEGGRGKYAGEPLVVIGGSSGVGQSVIQFAKLSGFSPIIATTSPNNNELIKSFGATHTVNRSADFDSSVKSITNTPIKYIFDCIGYTDAQTAAYSILASGGTLITLQPADVKDTVADKDIIFPFGSVHHPVNRAFSVEFYAYFSELLEKGEVKPNNVEVIKGGLPAVPDALDCLRKDQVSGKRLVMYPNETA